MSSFRIVLLSLAFRWPIGASYADNDCPVVGQRQLQLEHVARQGDSEVQLRQELTVESEDRILAAVRAVVHKDSEVDQTGMGNWVITEPGGCTPEFLVELGQQMPEGSKQVFASRPGGICAFIMRGSWDNVKKELLAHSWNTTPIVEAEADWGLVPEVPEPAIKSRSAAGSVPWGLDRIDQRHLALNGEYSPSGNLTGAGVHCYIVDTGIRTTHTDFGGRAVPTLEVLSDVPRECPPEDVECAMDINGHGTHCAGTIGGQKYGVAKGAMLHAVKVIADSGGGSFAWFIEAIDWVVAQGQKPAVLSASLGGHGTFQTIGDAISQAVNKGVIVVVAAGNEASDACGFSPANVAAAVTVGATTDSDEEATFSNYGGCVDIYAPGARIVSAGHNSDEDANSLSGTSMATPHVAGVAALMFQHSGSLSPAELANFLTSTATMKVINGLRPGSPNSLLFSNGLSEGQEAQELPDGPLLWTVTSGPCKVHGGCVSSPNYPASYGVGEGCTVATFPGMGPMDAVFDTEATYDTLTVNGKVYSGRSGPAEVTPTGIITWSSDETKTAKGWRLCPKTSTIPPETIGDANGQMRIKSLARSPGARWIYVATLVTVGTTAWTTCQAM